MDTVPGGHWHTTTIVGSLRGDGKTPCMIVDGAIDGASFLAYVQQVLSPTLRPVDVVVWDNLSSYQAAAVREAGRSGGGPAGDVAALQRRQ